MLVREVFGWLRYCLQQDALCAANQIVVEEIPSPFLSKMDTNDGPRTLAIYCQTKGYTPRLEIRFTSDFPQVWWVDKNDKGTYLLSPYSSKFPGDFRMWSRSELIRYLIDCAKSKLCHDTMTLVTLIPTEVDSVYKVEAGPKLDINTVKRIIDAAHRAVKKGTRLDGSMVNDWLKKNTSADLMDFAKDVVHYFGQGKLHWKDVDVLEDEFDPGKDIVPWAFFKAQFQDPKFDTKLTPPAYDRVHEEAAASYVERRVKDIIQARNDGRPVKEALNPLLSSEEFGLKVEAQLKRGKIPLPYLSLLEKADRKEELAPWSLIRRSVLAYDLPSAVDLPIADTILEWLEKSQLVSALYQSESSELLASLLKKKIAIFADQTINNPNWTRDLCDEVVGFTDAHAKAKVLQSEFDMWLLQALSPSVSASKLPLSPHAYNYGKNEEELYNRVFGSWLGAVKKSVEDRRELSIKTLSHSLENFYTEISSDWNKEHLEGYKPRVPSVKDIMAATLKGDKDKLFQVLVADVEDEIGSQMPEEVISKFKCSPYFNSIFKEIRFQSVRL